MALSNHIFMSGEIDANWINHTTGAVALTIDEGVNLEVLEIRLHLSAVGASGDFTATIDHGAGTRQDLLVLTQDMTSATDVHFIPTRPFVLSENDKLVCAYPNAGNKTYGCEVIWRKF